MLRPPYAPPPSLPREGRAPARPSKVQCPKSFIRCRRQPHHDTWRGLGQPGRAVAPRPPPSGASRPRRAAAPPGSVRTPASFLPLILRKPLPRRNNADHPTAVVNQIRLVPRHHDSLREAKSFHRAHGSVDLPLLVVATEFPANLNGHECPVPPLDHEVAFRSIGIIGKVEYRIIGIAKFQIDQVLELVPEVVSPLPACYTIISPKMEWSFRY